MVFVIKKNWIFFYIVGVTEIDNNG